MLCHIVKDLAVLIEPFMPNTARRIRIMLNIEQLRWSDLGKLNIMPGHKVNRQRILFDKLEDTDIKKLREQYSGRQETKRDETVMPLDLRVAEIKDVKAHPKADKLYILKVDLGNEERQIIAGLRGRYSEDELVGRKIVVVANLESVKLRGEASEAMLLVSEKGGEFELLDPQDAAAGERITAEGYRLMDKKISFKEFSSLDLKCEDGKALFNGTELKTSKGNVIVHKLKDGMIC